jgi:hypothetical protein
VLGARAASTTPTLLLFGRPGMSRLTLMGSANDYRRTRAEMKSPFRAPEAWFDRTIGRGVVIGL